MVLVLQICGRQFCRFDQVLQLVEQQRHFEAGFGSGTGEPGLVYNGRRVTPDCTATLGGQGPLYRILSWAVAVVMASVSAENWRDGSDWGIPKKIISTPFCPPQIPRGLVCDSRIVTWNCHHRL
jgi:hypothetical protein